MIQVKLLELKDRKISGFRKYPNFVTALNNVLGYTVETVFEQDKSFEGYYLVTIGAYTTLEFNNKLINEKTFLLSVINSTIPQYIEEFKPAGLTNWMLFTEASTAIIGITDVIKKAIIEVDDMIERHDGYADYVPIPFDGTYETVARSILKYLGTYDKCLKNKYPMLRICDP